MPDALIVVLVFIVGPLVLVLGTISLIKRRAARFGPDGSIADAFAGEDGAFTLALPEGQAVGIYVEYSIEAVRRGGGGISYGLVLRLDVERAGAAPFEQRGEYLIGQAQRPFGEVPLAESLDGGAHIRHGLALRRAMLLARVPAGGALRVTGKVKQTMGASYGLHVYAKPLA